MRRVSLIVDRVEAGECDFDEFYRRYVDLCVDDGVEPMPPTALLAILKALALGEEISERVTLH